MTPSTFWQTMTILPSVQAAKAKSQPPALPADLDPHLPSWELHPAGGPNRKAGCLETTWIHAHLP